MDSERSNLYSSNSGTLVNAFYKGVKEIITDKETYCWSQIFKDAKFDENNMCSAKETWLDIDRDKRYHSLTCRSIDGSLNGACDCNGVLTDDDMVSGIEEALNPERMNNLWGKYNSDLLSRAKEGARLFHIGTRWSLKDPQGVRQKILEDEGNTRYRVRKVPALDENNKSNFEYLFGVGFTTEYYLKKRHSYLSTNDEASWLAVYQQEPVERSGLLIPSSMIKTWNGEFAEGTKIDRIFAPIDVAFGGGDYLSMPVCYKVGNTVYVKDVVYDNRNKDYTQPKVIEMTLTHNIGTLRFEKNNGGDAYKDDISKKLNAIGYKCNIKAIPAPNTKAKEVKIFETAPDIIKNFVFLDVDKRSDEYTLFMTHLCSYTIMGKKQKDDSIDSLAQAVYELKETNYATVELFKRPF
jgi:predicted phage terminase large subunit-like protein